MGDSFSELYPLLQKRNFDSHAIKCAQLLKTIHIDKLTEIHISLVSNKLLINLWSFWPEVSGPIRLSE